MTWRIFPVTVLFLSGVVVDEAAARSKRVGQVPGGSAYSCNTCHTDGGGSPLNPFGMEIATSFLTAAGAAGDVIWGPELAALDSDGDGASNGAELGDPEGAWVVGDPDPGRDDDDGQEDHGEEDDADEEEDHHGEDDDADEEEDDHGEENGDDGEEEDHGEHGHEGDSTLEGKVFNPGDPASTPPTASHDSAVEVSTWARIKHRIGARD